MNKQKIIKIVLVIAALVVVAGGSFAYYLFNMPHRDVQSIRSDYQLMASDVVNEYLTNAASANEKYLDQEGDSKILQVTGVVAAITEDFNDQKVVLLKDGKDKAGVSCTFLSNSKVDFLSLKAGQTIVVKGVIRSGASYDDDLEMYENVIMEKCDLISKQ